MVSLDMIGEKPGASVFNSISILRAHKLDKLKKIMNNFGS